jgi:hypothetical protein
MFKKFLVALMLVAATPAFAETCSTYEELKVEANKVGKGITRITDAGIIKESLAFIKLVKSEFKVPEDVKAIVFAETPNGGGMILVETEAGLCDFIQTHSDAVFYQTITDLLGKGA